MRDSINTINYIMALPVCPDKKQEEEPRRTKLNNIFRSLLWPFLFCGGLIIMPGRGWDLARS